MVVAGIVLYNPSIDRLKKNIDSVIKQVDKLIVVFNSSKDEINYLFEDEKIVLVTNENNLGVAYALNQIIMKAKSFNAKWCLLLDQDSIVPNNIIKKYEEYTGDETIAIISPTVVDKNAHELSFDKEDQEVLLCITSGSYINLDICERIGLFNEEFFIDYVDWEYCARVKENGYKCVRSSSVILDHELGKISYHKILCFEIQTYNHNAFRKYYITRNSILIHKLYPKIKEFSHPYLRIFKRMIIVFLCENDKIKKVRAISRGIIDAFKLSRESNISA